MTERGVARRAEALLREELRVPRGFAIGTHGYREFVAEAGIGGPIHELLAGAKTLDKQAEASERIAALFMEGELQPALREELAHAYRELGEPPVADLADVKVADRGEGDRRGVNGLWAVHASRPRPCRRRRRSPIR